MKYALDRWDEIAKAALRAKILLLLDYDGTLAPISPSPSEALLPLATKNILKTLASAGGIRLAIVTGRGMANIKKMVGVKGITYVANHGLEVAGPALKYKYVIGAAYRGILKKILISLTAAFSGNRGVIIENKGLTVSLHYRKAPAKDAAPIKKFFLKTVKPYLKNKAVRIMAGKKIWEIRPPSGWDKGGVVTWLLGRETRRLKDANAVFPIYIGDDVTDEDAFRALRRKGITIRVGRPKSSKARFYLNDIDEVRSFLERISRLKKGR